MILVYKGKKNISIKIQIEIVIPKHHLSEIPYVEL